MTVKQDELRDDMRWVGLDLVEQVDDSWRLVGAACTSCGTRFFPAPSICAACLSRRLERLHLSPRGRLHSVTTVVMAPPGFIAPYRLGWVDLDDGPRAFGQVVPADGPEPRIGDAMKVGVAIVRREPDGIPMYAHVFSPA